MRILPSEPSPDFVVRDFPEDRKPNVLEALDAPMTTILSLLHTVANSMACDPGKLLRPLTDVARQLCGADAAGICIERNGELIPAETLPIVIASGSCQSLSGYDVPRAQSACAVALADGRPKFFQVPTTWLPIASPAYSPANGITAPWSAGSLRGTLWILNHSDAEPFGLSKYRTLLTLASLVGSTFHNLAEQEAWQHEAFLTTSQALTETLLEQVQLPLDEIQQRLRVGLRHTRGAGSHYLRDAAESLFAVSERIDSLLAMQSRPIQ